MQCWSLDENLGVLIFLSLAHIKLGKDNFSTFKSKYLTKKSLLGHINNKNTWESLFSKNTAKYYAEKYAPHHLNNPGGLSWLRTLLPLLLYKYLHPYKVPTFLLSLSLKWNLISDQHLKFFFRNHLIIPTVICLLFRSRCTTLLAKSYRNILQSNT